MNDRLYCPCDFYFAESLRRNTFEISSSDVVFFLSRVHYHPQTSAIIVTATAHWVISSLGDL